MNARGRSCSRAQPTLDRALTLLAERGVKRAIRLPVSVPSHSPLMRGAAEQLSADLAGVAIQPRGSRDPQCRCQQPGDADAIRAALVLQLSAPVRWIETIQKLVAGGTMRALSADPAGLTVWQAHRAGFADAGDRRSGGAGSHPRGDAVMNSPNGVPWSVAPAAALAPPLP